MAHGCIHAFLCIGKSTQRKNLRKFPTASEIKAGSLKLQILGRKSDEENFRKLPKTQPVFRNVKGKGSQWPLELCKSCPMYKTFPLRIPLGKISLLTSHPTYTYWTFGWSQTHLQFFLNHSFLTDYHQCAAWGILADANSFMQLNLDLLDKQYSLFFLSLITFICCLLTAISSLSVAYR